VTGYLPFWATAATPPVYVAANKPQMLRMSARVADGVMLSDLPPGIAGNTVRLLKTHLAEFGRSAEAFRISNFMAWHVYDDKEKGVREARQWLGYRGLFRRWVVTTFLSDEDYDLIEAHKSDFYQAAADGTHVIEGVPERILEALVANLTLTGHISEADEKIEHLKKLKSAGLTDIALELRQDPAASIKLIGEKVAPALR
jgi:alkanesulfonate monooxygenase SsuD/methylene tetrahydromethanopterin reductase-like flavin-dependent oxidoreductase (luciferase family)